jgi:type I restriction-modification system DNA methylase subunit
MKDSILSSIESLTDRNTDFNSLFFNSYQSGLTPDEMGRNFELSLERLERKQKGQYYTPKDIVEYIISRLDVKSDSNILDPACGCGSFLLSMFDIFTKKYGTDFIRNIYGVDIKEDAVEMTKACLFLLTGFNDKYKTVLKHNIQVGNSLIMKSLFDEYYPTLYQFDGFDFIIGNPPYITLKKHDDFDPYDPVYSKIINGPVNAASLIDIIGNKHHKC